VSLKEHQSVDRIRRNYTEARLRLVASALDQAATASMAGRFAWAHPRPSPAPSGAGVMMKSRTIETLERRLEERTYQLAFANQTRTELLAASHDLRQPMHALGLFVAQLRGLVREVEQKQVVDHIDAAVSALSQRFNEIIGLSKPDAAASGLDERDKIAGSTIPVYVSHNRTNGKLIVVIDDDLLVLDSTCGLIRSWGCCVVTSTSGSGALACLLGQQRPPDLIISDFRLADGKTGIEAIAELRSAFPTTIPAFLVSGDTSPAPLHEAQASGFHLLHKPVDPMRLRAMLNRMLKANN
jgi:CheY-like chemotaxis protein